MKRKADRMEGGERLWVRGELIGEGHYGLVYKAISKNCNLLPSVIAVKSAHISVSRSLQRERKVLTSFNGCDYIIHCYGEDICILDEDGRVVYNLLLEYASGGTLADLINSNGGSGLPETEVKHYTRCILEGLCKVHDFGYVHCDLKIDNILLVQNSGNDPQFVAKIGDFGLAKKRAKRVGLRGTPLYLSPETVNFGILETASDIWALGCVVLKMLTGKPPWEIMNRKRESNGSKLRELLDIISSEDKTPVIPAELSQEAKDFLRSCFVRDPEHRLTAHELLNHKFVVATKVEKKGNGEKELGPGEGFISLALSSCTCDFDGSFIPLEDSSCSSSSSSNFVDVEEVSDYNIIPNIHSMLANNSVIPIGV